MSIHDQVANLFYFPRNRLSANTHRAARAAAFAAWCEITTAHRAAWIPRLARSTSLRNRCRYLDDTILGAFAALDAAHRSFSDLSNCLIREREYGADIDFAEDIGVVT